MRLRILLALGALVLAGSGRLAHASVDAFPTDAIGRLAVDDAAVCTAFVVRSIERKVLDRSGGPINVHENWLVSAGHCNGQDLAFLLQGTAYPVARVLGFSAGGDRGHDVLVAAFFTLQPVATLEPAFGEHPKVGDKLMLIGYGRNALMMRVGPVVGFDERGHMEIENFASPGNSGGPVLIPGTRRVVGIGIETTVDVPAGIPASLCRVGGCSVKPPYTAVHVDRLMGVVSFR